MAYESRAGRQWTQLSFDDAGEPLIDTVFVVVDLETTGTSPGTDHITEIGAVKVRGGEVLAEFQSLVRTSQQIPAFISRLTGISDEMLRDQPSIGEALASFLEFSRGAVLVAHNARFDIGFLKQVCRDLAYPWPKYDVVDTVGLARAALDRGEVPNYKLATLAQYFKSSTVPGHRALGDARATVDVLHALLERLAGRGITHREDLSTATRKVPDHIGRKRRWADELTSGPGVYIFRDELQAPLYVGRSQNIRSRVRQYFNGHDTRAGIRRMVTMAHRVDGIACATELEARIRELRLIATHQPPFNQRSTRQSRAYWLVIEDEHSGSIRRLPYASDEPQGRRIGPFLSARTADEVHAVLAQCCGLPQPKRRSRNLPLTRLLDSERLSTSNRQVLTSFVAGDPRGLYDHLVECLRQLSRAEAFEQAAALRDVTQQLMSAVTNSHISSQLLAEHTVLLLTPLDAARETYELDLIRSGRHVAATSSSAKEVDSLFSMLVMSSDMTPPQHMTAEELVMTCSWIRRDGVRIYTPEGGITRPDIPVHDLASRFVGMPGINTDKLFTVTAR